MSTFCHWLLLTGGPAKCTQYIRPIITVNTKPFCAFPSRYIIYPRWNLSHTYHTLNKTSSCSKTPNETVTEFRPIQGHLTIPSNANTIFRINTALSRLTLLLRHKNVVSYRPVIIPVPPNKEKPLTYHPVFSYYVELLLFLFLLLGDRMSEKLG